MCFAGIAFTRNLELPQSVMNKVADKNIKFNNIVFRCCGLNNFARMTDYCGALVPGCQEFQKQTMIQ